MKNKELRFWPSISCCQVLSITRTPWKAWNTGVKSLGTTNILHSTTVRKGTIWLKIAAHNTLKTMKRSRGTWITTVATVYQVQKHLTSAKVTGMTDLYSDPFFFPVYNPPCSTLCVHLLAAPVQTFSSGSGSRQGRVGSTSDHLRHNESSTGGQSLLQLWQPSGLHPQLLASLRPQSWFVSSPSFGTSLRQRQGIKTLRCSHPDSLSPFPGWSYFGRPSWDAIRGLWGR